VLLRAAGGALVGVHAGQFGAGVVQPGRSGGEELLGYVDAADVHVSQKPAGQRSAYSAPTMESLPGEDELLDALASVTPPLPSGDGAAALEVSRCGEAPAGFSRPARIR